MTAGEWELYESLPFAENVAYTLNRKFEACLLAGMSADEVNETMHDFMTLKVNRMYGALDSEPQHQLRALIAQAYPGWEE